VLLRCAGPDREAVCRRLLAYRQDHQMSVNAVVDLLHYLEIDGVTAAMIRSMDAVTKSAAADLFPVQLYQIGGRTAAFIDPTLYLNHIRQLLPPEHQTRPWVRIGGDGAVDSHTNFVFLTIRFLHLGEGLAAAGRELPFDYQELVVALAPKTETAETVVELLDPVRDAFLQMGEQCELFSSCDLKFSSPLFGHQSSGSAHGCLLDAGCYGAAAHHELTRAESLKVSRAKYADHRVPCHALCRPRCAGGAGCRRVCAASVGLDCDGSHGVLPDVKTLRFIVLLLNFVPDPVHMWMRLAEWFMRAIKAARQALPGTLAEVVTDVNGFLCTALAESLLMGADGKVKGLRGEEAAQLFAVAGNVESVIARFAGQTGKQFRDARDRFKVLASVGVELRNCLQYYNGSSESDIKSDDDFEERADKLWEVMVRNFSFDEMRIYAHYLLVHGPELRRRLGPLAPFGCQPVEAKVKTFKKKVRLVEGSKERMPSVLKTCAEDTARLTDPSSDKNIKRRK
jgi:hypothetical protein